MSNLLNKNYSLPLPTVEFPKTSLLEMLEALPLSDWEHGCDRNGIYWPVHECRSLPDNELTHSLLSFLNAEERGIQLNRNIFVSRVHPGGLPVHSDHHRLCALNFYLSGENSKMIFVDDFDNVLEAFDSNPQEGVGESCYLLNTMQKHGVTYPINASQQRYTLTISLYNHFDKIRTEILEGRFFRSNEHFKY
jgi:hypothetical protein